METGSERPTTDPTASSTPSDLGGPVPEPTEPQKPADPPPTAERHGDMVLSERTIDVGTGDIGSGPKEAGRAMWIVKDEVIRATVALMLLALLAYVIFMAFKRAKTWDETKQLLDSVLPAVTALLGSAVGFYFGTKSG